MNVDSQWGVNKESSFTKYMQAQRKENDCSWWRHLANNGIKILKKINGLANWIELTLSILMPLPWNLLINSSIRVHICSYSVTYLLSFTDSTMWRSQSRNISSPWNRCSFKTLTGLSASQMICQDRSCISPQTVFQLTWCLRKTFLLTHKLITAWVIEMTADRDEWSELRH